MPGQGARIAHRQVWDRNLRPIPAQPPAVLAGRWWLGLAAVAGAMVLLIGGVEGAVSGAAPEPVAADRSTRWAEQTVESGDGRLRSHMTVHQATTGTFLIFEVQVRDRTWMAPDGRLVRIVVRDLPGGATRDSRQAVVAATTLPRSATGFTFFTATLDVTSLAHGHYLASVELLGTDAWPARAPRGDVIDRATHPYLAPGPPITAPCCLFLVRR